MGKKRKHSEITHDEAQPQKEQLMMSVWQNHLGFDHNIEGWTVFGKGAIKERISNAGSRFILLTTEHIHWIVSLRRSNLRKECYTPFLAIFGVSLRSIVHIWVMRKKGPLYVAMFKPIGIIFAVIMGIAFLGDSIYLGSRAILIYLASAFPAIADHWLVSILLFYKFNCDPSLSNQDICMSREGLGLCNCEVLWLWLLMLFLYFICAIVNHPMRFILI
ncbi:uncharacterized protein [Glycine max]|uniref:uncharacterized protein isoform X1 n=1 Tax=Glycine max TaxID=3847 RepID=UPI000E21B3C0|nr:uncharacterized protein LOC102668139 isoform X1 [Glycine max]XP_040860861.1 uncharacterized protein LOC102668139 isoform X1 [Glycine max]|eukprot:XP_025979508.1 uncharacterized protein LOC102668139 isoform X1 [Glycine max]